MVQLIEGLKSKIIADGTAEQQVPHRDGLQTSGSHVKCITLVTRKAFGDLGKFLGFGKNVYSKVRPFKENLRCTTSTRAGARRRLLARSAFLRNARPLPCAYIRHPQSSYLRRDYTHQIHGSHTFLHLPTRYVGCSIRVISWKDSEGCALLEQRTLAAS